MLRGLYQNGFKTIGISPRTRRELEQRLIQLRARAEHIIALLIPLLMDDANGIMGNTGYRNLIPSFLSFILAVVENAEGGRKAAGEGN